MIGNIVAGITSPTGVASPPVTGYQLWLDGKDASVFSFSSGSVVSEWRDKSGNGYNFTQATVANQPTRGSDGLVDFDGSNDSLVAASKFMNNLHNGGANTIFIVLRADVDADYAIMGTNNDGSSGIGSSLFRQASFDRITQTVNNATPGVNIVAGFTANNSFLINTTYLFIERLDADLATAADRSIFYVNNGAAQANSTATGTPSASTSTSFPALGTNAAGFANLDGRIGEVIWYTSDLSTTDRESVRDFLLTKWSL